MTVTAKICRRMSPKTLAFSAIGLTILLCIYYASYTTDVNQRRNPDNLKDSGGGGIIDNRIQLSPQQPQRLLQQSNSQRGNIQKELEVCPKLVAAEADISTLDVYKEFDFQPTWMKTKEYWDKSFEDRFERQKMDPDRPPLKVIIVPHSHNDPGWLKTFEHYYNYASRPIMHHMVSKLQQYKNLTFIWSEVAFLNAWWEEAHPSKQRALKNLVQSGRLEITTGGWVMTDEANAHVFAMVDQLIEGHQWVWSNLGIKPKTGWSVDPFGHSSTQPYLLSLSGINGTVIQRIHYAWKQWLALKQYGDFRWIPNWYNKDGKGTILTHNQPFDIYSIKHSCGPHPYICLNFDFRKVPGEYTEYSIKAQTINDKNIKEKSELLLEQYSKTGSLLPHNVVLMPLGDDFRYNVLDEWDQQYKNYIKLINYINNNKNLYKTEIKFGTPKEYFLEIIKRYDQYPTLKGDFFVYSDIFSEGRPAYWSGYYTTRPYMKILGRELENNLRSTEILYTITLNLCKKFKLLSYIKILERDYEKLIKSRRNLALFQHHDAITGTSKSFVMRDYGLKLFESIRDTIFIQQNSIKSLFYPNNIPIKTSDYDNLILIDYERDSFEKLIKKTPILINKNQTRKIIIYNSLTVKQEHLIQIRCNSSNIIIKDDNNNDVLYQINPVFDNNNNDNTKLFISNDEFEVVFIANLQPLSLTLFNIIYNDDVNNDDDDDDRLATVYCNKCYKRYNNNNNNDNIKFKLKTIPNGDIQLENDKLKILFNGNSGFMKSITRKNKKKIMQCKIKFGAYKSAQFHSGAYLFMPDPNEQDYEKDILEQYKNEQLIIIKSGKLISELTVIYGPFLLHTIGIIHNKNSILSNNIYINNIIDYENPPKNRESELFLRFITDIQNGEPPEFYTDLNGLQIQKRIKIERIGIEGNYYPITTMAFIQDDNVRLTILTNHPQGASSWQPGYLELMLDRRTLYDDSRGMGEGLVDNKKTIHKYWLLIEDINNINEQSNTQRFDNNNINNNNDDDDTFDKGDVLRTFNQPTENVGGAAAGSNNNNNNNGGGGGNIKSEIYPAPSLYCNHLSNMLIYPPFIYIIEYNKQQNNINKSINLINNNFPCDVHLLTLRTQSDQIYSQFPSSSAFMILHRQGYDCRINFNNNDNDNNNNNNNLYKCLNNNFNKNTTFYMLNIKDIQAKTLTGIDTLDDNLNDFSDIYIDSMALKTFNITFV